MRLAIIVALLSFCATAVAAPGSGNRGQTEWSFGIPYYLETSAGSANGSDINFSARLGFEFGVDYYIIDRLAVGFDLAWVRPNYNAVLVPDDGGPDIHINHQANIWTGQFNVTYNFTDKVVTPYVEAGAGLDEFRF